MNSWGHSWGQFGYFMVERGKNTFCTELDVSGIVPRFRGFNTTLEDMSVPFNETLLYKENFGSNSSATYVNLF